MINQLVKWLSFIKAFVNNRFIAALCFKVDNNTTLDILLLFFFHSVQAKSNKQLVKVSLFPAETKTMQKQ